MRDVCPDHLRRGRCFSYALLAGLVLSNPAAAAAWEINPRIDVGESYTDNVELTADEESDFITEVTPGIELKREATQFRASADYQFQSLWYADNSDFDDHYHDFQGNAFARSDDGSLTLDATANYDQQNIDPEAAVGFNNLLRSDNRTDVARAQITPGYSGSLADYVDTAITYSYSIVNFRNTDATGESVDDSNRHFFQAIFGDLTDPGLIDWQTSYQYSRTEFDSSDETFEYQRAGAQIGYAVNPRTRLLVSGGLESDVEDDVGAGDLDATYYDVGINWQPNKRQTLEARAGERYFGTSYFFRWTRRARLTFLDVSYTEEAVTSNDQLFALDNVGVPPGFSRARLDTDVFIRRRFGAGYRLDLSKNTFDTNAYYEDRDYQLSDRKEQVAGFGTTWTWEIGQRTKLTTTANLENRNFSGDDDIYRFRIGLERELSRILTLRLRLARIVRNAENSEDYRANGASVYLRASF